MADIKLLDCTLRDGGRIIDCKFPNNWTQDIINRLAVADIDIVEVGFLDNTNTKQCDENSTYFSDIRYISQFINKKNSSTLFCAFINYGSFDFTKLKPYNGKSVDALRIGFKKHNFLSSFDNIINDCIKVKQLGYKLFVQGINCLGYEDKEFLEIINRINEIKPYAFAIVDTYGGMYPEDLEHVFNLVNDNLDKDIIIDFHSHNNLQLSFALAQEFINLAKKSDRNIIIDSTLSGVGKCSGNLCTELIANYLNRKMNHRYNFEEILSLIDDYIPRLKENHFWGYQTSYFLGGLYCTHPNNIIELSEKQNLPSKSVKNILENLTPKQRIRPDYFTR